MGARRRWSGKSGQNVAARVDPAYLWAVTKINIFVLPFGWVGPLYVCLHGVLEGHLRKVSSRQRSGRVYDLDLGRGEEPPPSPDSHV